MQELSKTVKNHEAICGQDRDRAGYIVLRDTDSGNFLSVSVYLDGRVEVHTVKTFPRVSLSVANVTIGKNGAYDEIVVQAHLKEEDRK